MGWETRSRSPPRCPNFAHAQFLCLAGMSLIDKPNTVASLRWPPIWVLPPAPLALGLFQTVAGTFALAPNDPSHRYSVSVCRVGDSDRWVWEIQRIPLLGVRLNADNFRSPFPAGSWPTTNDR